MLVGEMMSKCVTECTEDMSLSDVYDLICKCDHGLVVVIDSHAHRVPIGVVSERSICEQIIARGRSPRTLIAGSCMDSRIKTLSETDLVGAISAEGLDNITAIVVTNMNRQVSGLIPKSAFANLCAKAASRPSQGAARHESGVVRTPAISEIPAFGWVQ